MLTRCKNETNTATKVTTVALAYSYEYVVGAQRQKSQNIMHGDPGPLFFKQLMLGLSYYDRN